MKTKLKIESINNIDYNPKLDNSTKSKKDIESQTNKYLTGVFTITEVDRNSEEGKKLDYKLLQDIYQKIYNLDKKATTNEIKSLLKDYIEVYRYSSKELQNFLKGRLEIVLKHKKMSVLVKQIEKDGGLLKFGERRFHIK